MSERYEALNDEHQRFIEQQKVFFVATAAQEGPLLEATDRDQDRGL